jgi:hypothetical protein
LYQKKRRGKEKCGKKKLEEKFGYLFYFLTNVNHPSFPDFSKNSIGLSAFGTGRRFAPNKIHKSINP